MMDTTAWGQGIATVADNATVLDAWFPTPHLGSLPTDVDPRAVPAEFSKVLGPEDRRAVRRDFVTVESALTSPPTSTVDAYLRLHLLSHRLAKPNSINLDGIFGLLPTVVWTNAGPIHPDDASRLRAQLQSAGISAHSVDKFPRLVDYVTPPGVRIADADRVRLGAYLSPGTTVMHEGFVNFNAGTLGASMVEGRISQGVLVGDGSDIGGGASIMGTLSGGGTERISIGERTLLGANAGVGISLGDDCIVEAGLYVTAGTKVLLASAAPTASGEAPSVAAASLSGRSGLLFRRHSLTGAVEVHERAGEGVRLNTALHV